MGTRILARAGFALLPTIALAGCHGADWPLAINESQVETRAFEPGGQFTLENVNGRVTVATWSEPRVRIEAEKSASSRARLDQLRVEIDGEGHRVSVRTRAPRGWGWFSGGGTKVDYRITLPADALVRVSTVNGRVAIEGMTGAVNVSTTNGRVEITDARGGVEASTVNGGITARYRALDAQAHHRLSTTNGPIAVWVPGGEGGRVAARTVNGGIHCDLALEATHRTGRHRLEGRIGKGNGSLELRTVNGPIRINRS